MMNKKQILIQFSIRFMQCFTLAVFVFIFWMGFVFWKSKPEGYIPFVIQTHTTSVTVHAEVALTPEQQIRGLMFRKSLPENDGMLFVFPTKQIVSMWMKNTYIPLDMIFFDDTRKVVHIHQNARPHDLTIISSLVPATGVLEVNAGFVRKHHITLGNQINYPSVLKD